MAPKISYFSPYDTNKIKKIVEWFLSYMELNNSNFTLTINGAKTNDFTKHGKEYTKGYGLTCKDYNNYTIYLKTSLLACNPILFLEIIFEELFHIYQFVKEGLIFNQKCEKWSYEGKQYPKDSPYELSPWEINAKKWTQKIIKTYINEN